MTLTYARRRPATRVPVETARAGLFEAAQLVGAEGELLRRAFAEALAHLCRRQQVEAARRIVRVEPLPIQELEEELRYYETEFGMQSETFAEAYARGEHPAVLEETALEWVMAYHAMRIAIRGREAGTDQNP